MQEDEQIFDIREKLCDPHLLGQIGAAWKLFFFLLLQGDISDKSYSTHPEQLSKAMGVTMPTLSSWLSRLSDLGIISIKSSDERIRLQLLPPFNRILLVTEETQTTDRSASERKHKVFDESTTDVYLKRRFRTLQKVEEDIDFIFNKLQSLELRLSALEGSYQQSQSQHRAKQ